MINEMRVGTGIQWGVTPSDLHHIGFGVSANCKIASKLRLRETVEAEIEVRRAHGEEPAPAFKQPSRGGLAIPANDACYQTTSRSSLALSSIR